MSYSQSAGDTTATEGEHRLLGRRSQAAASCALIGRPRLASPLLVAVLGLASVLTGAQGASSTAEQNWPQWRGPLQSGVAPHADPPTEWSETKNINWKVRIPGEGTATPV